MKRSEPDTLRFYFRDQRRQLLLVTISGILYNVGMTAGPWFEGYLAQTLYEILGKNRPATAMLLPSVLYVCVILLVQGMRYIKRFYVRRFSNNVGRSLKLGLYRNLLYRTGIENEQAGTVMTRVVADADTCAEGMRKAVTEVFDTGVVMVAYMGMLLSYDWRLTLLACAFTPVAYLLAERMKKKVSTSAAAVKESAGALNSATLDRVSGALTYRVLGAEPRRDEAYEQALTDYERKATVSGVLETSLQPLYRVISMAGVIIVLWLGVRNVRGYGWSAWDIAAFTTFLSCFGKLTMKSSKAAKLFNAVQKARVSWGRIQPYLHTERPLPELPTASEANLTVNNLAVLLPDGRELLSGISFTAHPGELIGVTGPVAGGKTMLGKALAGLTEVRGNILWGGRELAAMPPEERRAVVGYLGHEPQLLTDTVEENICLGEKGDIFAVLQRVCLQGEVLAMPEKEKTCVGSGGVRLSGGQQARLALARTLFHRRPLLVLDDPISALDEATAQAVFRELRREKGIVILISHRTEFFSETDRVLFVENGHVTVSAHERLLHENQTYRELFRRQKGGEKHEKQ